jgi:hypothetical protein
MLHCTNPELPLLPPLWPPLLLFFVNIETSAD